MRSLVIAASLCAVLSAAPVFAQAAGRGGQAPAGQGTGRGQAPAQQPPAAGVAQPLPPTAPFPAGAKIGLVNLQQLELQHCGITDKGLRQLTGLKKLHRLIINSTQTTEEGRAQLKAAIPGLEIQPNP